MTQQTYIAFVKPTLIDITKSLVKGNFDRYKSFTNSLVKADKECGTIYKSETITVNCYQFMSRMKHLNTGKPFVKQVWENKQSIIKENRVSRPLGGKITESKETKSTYKVQHT